MEDDFWVKKRFDLLNDSWQLLKNTWDALSLSTDKTLPKPEGKKTFSDFNTEKQLALARGPLNVGRMVVSAYVVGNNLKLLTDILNPDYQFSTDIDNLNAEIVLLLGFLGVPGKAPDFPDVRHPSVDFAVMKALFAGGRMLERLQQKGVIRSDRPAKAGSSPWKDRVSKQEVIKAYHEINTEGKTKHGICQAVKDYLLQWEAKRGEKVRMVYSVKSIERILTNEESVKEF